MCEKHRTHGVKEISKNLRGKEGCDLDGKLKRKKFVKQILRKERDNLKDSMRRRVLIELLLELKAFPREKRM